MDGLLLKLLDDRTGQPGRWFWRLFQPIRQDLDRLFWCFTNEPWLGAPAEFGDDDVAAFEGEGRTSVMLWRQGRLGRFADDFVEEFIELWGIEPTANDPRQVAARYNAAAWRDMEGVIRQYAHVWLLYTDSVCWEIYSRDSRLLDETRIHVQREPWVTIHKSHADHRADGFRTAGLSKVWDAAYGQVEALKNRL